MIDPIVVSKCLKGGIWLALTMAVRQALTACASSNARLRGGIFCRWEPSGVDAARTASDTGLMHRIKTFGYFVSTISVVLLAIVSWTNESKSPLLMACLIVGATTSIVGMFCRWFSYEVEERRKGR